MTLREQITGLEANLEEIIERGITFGATNVFLNTNHPTGRTSEKMFGTDYTYQEHNEKYNEIIRRITEESPHGVILNDIDAA